MLTREQLLKILDENQGCVGPDATDEQLRDQVRALGLNSVDPIVEPVVEPDDPSEDTPRGFFG